MRNHNGFCHCSNMFAMKKVYFFIRFSTKILWPEKKTCLKFLVIVKIRNAKYVLSGSFYGRFSNKNKKLKLCHSNYLKGSTKILGKMGNKQQGFLNTFLEL